MQSVTRTIIQVKEEIESCNPGGNYFNSNRIIGILLDIKACKNDQHSRI